MTFTNKYADRDLFKLLYPTTHVDDLVAFFGGNNRAMVNLARWLGVSKSKDYIKYYNKIFGGNAHRYNKNNFYFRKINIENSTVAGFIAADGTISKKKSAIRIRLQIRDIDYLEKIRALLSFTGLVTTYFNKSPASDRVFEYCMLHINSADYIIEDLEKNFNITPNKTYTLKPPTHLDKDNSLAFISGLVDGDGSIRIDNRSLNPSLIIEISGTRSLLEWVKYWFDFISPINTIATVRKHAVDAGYSYSLQGRRALEVCSYLLSLDLPLRLERKWDKAIRIIDISRNGLSLCED